MLSRQGTLKSEFVNWEQRYITFDAAFYVEMFQEYKCVTLKFVTIIFNSKFFVCLNIENNCVKN